MFLLYIQNVHEVDISIVAQIALVASERKAELQSLNIEQDTYVRGSIRTILRYSTNIRTSRNNFIALSVKETNFISPQRSIAQLVFALEKVHHSYVVSVNLLQLASKSFLVMTTLLNLAA